MKISNLLENEFKIKLLAIQTSIIDAPGDFNFTILDAKESVISRDGFDFKQKVSNANVLNLKATGWMHQHKNVDEMLRFFCLCHFADFFASTRTLIPPKTHNGYKLATKPVERYGTALTSFRCYPPKKQVETGLLRHMSGSQGLTFEIDLANNDRMTFNVPGLPTPMELFTALVDELDRISAADQALR